MPPRWASSSREVIGHSFCGNAGQYFWTGASRSNLPRSQSCRMAVAVIRLEMDPSRKSVEEVTGAGFSKSAMPNPADQASSPSRTTATPIPGTLFADMKLETAFSICARFSAERLFCCAEAAETAPIDKTSRQSTHDRKRLPLASRVVVFTDAPRARVYRKLGTAGTVPRKAPACTESVTPWPPECVDLMVSRSLPWRDEPTAAYCGECPAVLGSAAGLRGRGKKAGAGTRCGAQTSAGGSSAGSCGTCSFANRESAAPLLCPAVARGSGWQGLPDPEGQGKICLRRAEFQSRSS